MREISFSTMRNGVDPMTDIDQEAARLGREFHKGLPKLLTNSKMFSGMQRRSEMTIRGRVGDEFILKGRIDYCFASVRDREMYAHVIEGKMRSQREPIDSLQAICYALMLANDPLFRYLRCNLHFYYGGSNDIVQFNIAGVNTTEVMLLMSKLAGLSLEKAETLKNRKKHNRELKLTSLQRQLDADLLVIQEIAEARFGIPSQL